MISDIVNLLSGEDNKEDVKRYSRLVTLFGLSLVVNGVRCNVLIPNDNKPMPINVYSVALGGSGLGKTRSVNYMKEFIEPAMAEIKRKTQSRVEMLDPFNSEEIMDLTKDGVTISDTYKSLTDASTLKLMRVLDLSDYYSINYIIDEFASVVQKDYEMLSSTILEIYDRGYVPVNLRATSKTAKATSPIPLNMMAFGSPHLLWEGDSATEKAFIDLLQAGLARRCLFVNVETSVNKYVLDGVSKIAEIKAVKDKFIAIQEKYDHKDLSLSDEAKRLYLDYHDRNVEDSVEVSEFNQLEKIYKRNTYWLALKISALIAVSKMADRVEVEHYQEAIDIVSDSIVDFVSMLNRPEKYEIVVDWLLEQGTEENEYTLTSKLPFYKDVKNKRQFLELMKGYAFQKNITLMIQEKQNISFYSAKGRKKVDLTQPLLFSYSADMAKDYYDNDDFVWSDLYKVITSKNKICYSAHGFENGHRTKDNALEGFELVILDIDDSTSLEMAKLLFEDYTYLIATTRSHQKEKNGVVCDRFRIILPMKDRLELNKDQYSKFYEAMMDDLPIEVDGACKDISRMFFSSEGEYFYNEGVMFDASKYIPNTQESEIYNKEGVKLAKKNINGIGQYIIRNEGGGRNNQLTKYALLLMDTGYSHDECKEEVLRLNKQFQSPLAESEIKRTIFKTIERKEEIEVEEDEEEYGYEYEEDDIFSKVDK